MRTGTRLNCCLSLSISLHSAPLGDVCYFRSADCCDETEEHHRQRNWEYSRYVRLRGESSNSRCNKMVSTTIIIIAFECFFFFKFLLILHIIEGFKTIKWWHWRTIHVTTEEPSIKRHCWSRVQCRVTLAVTSAFWRTAWANPTLTNPSTCQFYVSV